MKKNYFPIAIFIVISFILYITSCSNSDQNLGTDNTKINESSNVTKTERGKYLVTTMGCNDCHSPKKVTKTGSEVIPELMLSGFPSDRPKVKFDNNMIISGYPMFYPDLTGAAGPWGVTYASNLTPDETGISDWTEEQFKKAITQGKYNGQDNVRMLLPPMPWQNLVNISNDDLSAIFTYLKSIKPVRNMVPSPTTPDNM
jgi:hypothetical protein